VVIKLYDDEELSKQLEICVLPAKLRGTTII